MRARTLFAAFVILLGLAAAPRSALAWDELGHMVVVRIAWSELSPATRARVTAILLEAPADAGLVQLRPAPDDPQRDLMFAAYASTWPDIIRRHEPAERHAYHRPPWHYINWFWSEGTDGEIIASSTLKPDTVNIAVELERQSRIVADSAAPAAERAVALAWLLHLVGDIHQPLHASARVTAEEPAGDKGGNTFKLDGTMSLHWYWDEVLTARYPRRTEETDEAYVARVTASVVANVPRDSLAPRLAEPSFDLWAMESLQAAERQVYCCGVTRGAAAPESYLAHADAVSEPAIALAGHRLAALLERLLGA